MLTDETETLKWIRRGAERGNTESQFSLGIAYLLGECVEKDFIASYMWLGLSALGGHEEAPEFLEALAKKMEESDIDRAQACTNDWLARRRKG